MRFSAQLCPWASAEQEFISGSYTPAWHIYSSISSHHADQASFQIHPCIVQIALEHKKVLNFMKLWDKKKFRLLSYHLHLVSLSFCSFYSEFSFLSCHTFFGFQEHLLTLLKAQKWYSSIAALLCRWQHLKATKISVAAAMTSAVDGWGGSKGWGEYEKQ